MGILMNTLKRSLVIEIISCIILFSVTLFLTFVWIKVLLTYKFYTYIILYVGFLVDAFWFTLYILASKYLNNKKSEIILRSWQQNLILESLFLIWLLGWMFSIFSLIPSNIHPEAWFFARFIFFPLIALIGFQLWAVLRIIKSISHANRI